jgi:hypothetical protein
MNTADQSKSEIRNPEQYLNADGKYLYSVIDLSSYLYISSSTSSSSSFSSSSSKTTVDSIYY